MKIDMGSIRQKILSLFSQNGYSIKNLKINFPDPLNLNVSIDNEQNIHFNFDKNPPKVSWKKFITLSAWIQKIVLGQESGTIKLKYLPEITFSYSDEENEKLFGQKNIDFSDINQDIIAEYQDEERQKIANKCLQYAQEWATITSNGGVDFAQCSNNDKRKLKKDCKEFVTDNIKNDPEMKSGSFLLMFLFFYVVLPVILKFILERIFRKLFN